MFKIYKWVLYLEKYNFEYVLEYSGFLYRLRLNK